MKSEFEKIRRLAIQQEKNISRKAANEIETTEDSAVNGAQCDLRVWKVAISRAVRKGCVGLSINSNWWLPGNQYGKSNQKSVPEFDSIKFFGQRSPAFLEAYRKELQELLGEPFKVLYSYHACDEGYTSPPYYSFSVSWCGF